MIDEILSNALVTNPLDTPFIKENNLSVSNEKVAKDESNLSHWSIINCFFNLLINSLLFTRIIVVNEIYQANISIIKFNLLGVTYE